MTDDPPRPFEPSELLAEIERLAALMHPGGRLVCPVGACDWDVTIPPPVLVQDLAAPGVTVLRWDGYRRDAVEAYLAGHVEFHALAALLSDDHPDRP